MSKISHMNRSMTRSNEIVDVLEIQHPDIFEVINKLCDLANNIVSDPLTGGDIAEVAEVWYLTCDLLAHVQHCARQEQQWEQWSERIKMLKLADGFWRLNNSRRAAGGTITQRKVPVAQPLLTFNLAVHSPSIAKPHQ